MNSILIVAGENSGDKYGANLISQFKKLHPSFSFFGIGGKHMEAEGVELIARLEEISIMGVTGVISRFPRLKALFDRMKREAKRRKPSAAVLIDSPGFNLRLVKKLKNLSIPVLYYISPTVWAWRRGRLKTIKKNVEKMLLIFPFEVQIYENQGIPHTYVGHPLKERVRVSLTKEEFFQKYKLDPQKKLISLLPGSRKSELKHHLPVLVETVQRIKCIIPSQFTLLLAESVEEKMLHDSIPKDFSDFTILSDDKYEAMASSDLVLSACGTANLEAALLETPFISFYRASCLNYSIAKCYARLTRFKLKNFSIVNILAGKRIIPELIQKEFTPANILQETKKILESDEIRTEMIACFREINNSLGEEKASQNAARELDTLISSSSHL